LRAHAYIWDHLNKQYRTVLFSALSAITLSNILRARDIKSLLAALNMTPAAFQTRDLLTGELSATHTLMNIHYVGLYSLDTARAYSWQDWNLHMGGARQKPVE